MTARRPNPQRPPALAGSRAKCGICHEMFTKALDDREPRCHGCRSLDDPARVNRARAEATCALCGQAVQLSWGVVTHAEEERDEYHRPMIGVG